jgi:hypothetical protein
MLGRGSVAARGVSWTAEKVATTETYKKWEAKPAGPRAKAASEVAASTIAALLTVGYGR